MRTGAYLLVVDRDRFLLEVWKRRTFSGYRSVGKHPVAIGDSGYMTPRGVYFVIARAKNPDWLMPNSEWVAPENRGKTIKGGDPSNPIKAAFLKLTDDGIGIHGTADLDSLGTRASHGCIRVAPSVAIDLYRRVRVGTPCVIL